MERTKRPNNLFNIKSGEQIIKLYIKGNVFLIAWVFEKPIKVSINEFDINLLYCFTLLGYTWQCGL